MKQISAILLFLGLFLQMNAQVKPAAKPAVSKATPAKPAAPAAKPVAAKPQPVLKNSTDSMSYAIGMLDGNFFKTQGITSVNSASLSKGFSDVMSGKTLFSPEQADMIVRNEMQRLGKQKIQPNIDACNNFLAENAKKPGVKRTASGLQYEVIKEGTGAKPVDTNIVRVHYEGFLLNKNEPFDSSKKRGQPAEFRLNEVIRGWTEGVQLMTVGSTYKFYIPYQLGYGEQGSGEVIPGGSVLIFEVELIDIVNK